MNKWMMSAILAAVPSMGMAATLDFDTLPTGTADYWNGSDGSGGFTQQWVRFTNEYDDYYTSWGGWAYSKVNDTTTSGFGNQYAAFTGTDKSGSGQYGVCYIESWSPGASKITLPVPTTVGGMYVTNTTYTALDLLGGGSFTKKFGGISGNDADWLKLTITGYNGTTVTGSVDFYLADYRFTNNEEDYIVNDWRWVDLTSLGSQVTSLNFTMSSTDNGMFGMNTPSYFAADGLQVAAVPEPASLALLSLTGAGLLARRRSK